MTKTETTPAEREGEIRKEIERIRRFIRLGQNQVKHDEVVLERLESELSALAPDAVDAEPVGYVHGTLRVLRGELGVRQNGNVVYIRRATNGDPSRIGETGVEATNEKPLVFEFPTEDHASLFYDAMYNRHPAPASGKLAAPDAFWSKQMELVHGICVKVYTAKGDYIGIGLNDIDGFCASLRATATPRKEEE